MVRMMSDEKIIVPPENSEKAGQGPLPNPVNRSHTLRLGISQCLLGEQVRFDGGHKRDRFLTDTLGPFVDWIPVCPEVEAGLGTPREAMRLVGAPEAPRLLTIKTQKDLTSILDKFSHRKIQELKALDLDGFIFKKDSPSCGIKQVRVYQHPSSPSRKGSGLFAQAFQKAFPLIPIEDEGRLNDPWIRENFIERIFAYHRWQNLLAGGLTRRGIVAFHTQHKYFLMAHSRPHYHELGRMVASAKQYTPHQLAIAYGGTFTEALKVKTTVRKHVNVLQHLVGHIKENITQSQRQELQELISDYHRGFTPLIAPLTLINHYVREHQVSYLADQVYLQPHPKELILKNHA